MSTHIPKAVLYYDAVSAWSSAVRLALEEKGYGDDEVDLRIVDLGKGENLTPSFLRLNPKGMFHSSDVIAAPDCPSRNCANAHRTAAEYVVRRYGKPAIVDLLDRSRSAMSRTHTTSYRPAPSLSPATIALCAVTDSIISLLHEGPVSPEQLFYSNARNQQELQEIAKTILPDLQGRKDALSRFLSENETSEVRVSEKTKKFWLEKKQATEELLSVHQDADKSDTELTTAERDNRQKYFESSKAAWEIDLSLVLTRLSQELTGPYALGTLNSEVSAWGLDTDFFAGDQFSIADVHITGWLAWIIFLSGGKLGDSGSVAVQTIEQHVGGGYKLPRDAIFTDGTDATTSTEKGMQSKLAILWDAVKERPSWKRVYEGR
ncbi:hypothetical protein EWM64_g3067 [Hericium alpestre]|uniref:GST N-terminal domain-containing protein n=1 Tax=Hericium alpestre TaxID=135208 RepID=A0A4Z0A3C4_9AGAM|nr:hypothetical protein EWM64_g3067 [Hericium alpestre]